jgi:hypothetical protein
LRGKSVDRDESLLYKNAMLSVDELLRSCASAIGNVPVRATPGFAQRPANTILIISKMRLQLYHYLVVLQEKLVV